MIKIIFSGQECEQNVSADPVQSLPQDQRQTWWRQLNLGAKHQAKDFQ